jgi:hypothetical protein
MSFFKKETTMILLALPQELCPMSAGTHLMQQCFSFPRSSGVLVIDKVPLF